MADQKRKARLIVAMRAQRAMGLNDVAIPRRAARATGVSVAPTRVARPAPAAAAPLKAPAKSDVAAKPRAVQAKVDTPNLLSARSPLPASDPDRKADLLRVLDHEQVRTCRKCGLCAGRTQTVFGEGDVNARVLFIGEGPGENEDLTGRPFVGRAGELLDKMISGGMGMRRSDVYICNIVKCRPPNNRAPTPEEVAACTPFLDRQIELIAPKAIITLGAPATKYILGRQDLKISQIRGQWFEYRGVRVMPTFHPAYILRNYTPETRGAVWSDLKLVVGFVQTAP